MPGQKDPRDRLINFFFKLYLALAFVFLFLPIVVIVVFSFNVDKFPSFPLKGFTLGWYVQLAGDSRLLDSLKNSLIVASSVSILSAVFGFMGAYALRSYKFKRENIFLGIMMAPLTVPALILALALLIFLNNVLFIYNSLGSVIISHLVFCAPFAMFIIRARLTSMRSNLEEAAWDLGANTFQTIKEVVLPLSIPGLIAALLLTFTLSFDEFIIAWFVSGFQPTLPVKIWTMMRAGIEPTINAIGSIVFVLSMTSLLIGEYFMRKKAG